VRLIDVAERQCSSRNCQTLRCSCTSLLPMRPIQWRCHCPRFTFKSNGACEDGRVRCSLDADRRAAGRAPNVRVVGLRVMEPWSAILKCASRFRLAPRSPGAVIASRFEAARLPVLPST